MYWWGSYKRFIKRFTAYRRSKSPTFETLFVDLKATATNYKPNQHALSNLEF